jgi:hypothetical protein
MEQKLQTEVKGEYVLETGEAATPSPATSMGRAPAACFCEPACSAGCESPTWDAASAW